MPPPVASASSALPGTFPTASTGLASSALPGIFPTAKMGLAGVTFLAATKSTLCSGAEWATITRGEILSSSMLTTLPGKSTSTVGGGR